MEVVLRFAGLQCVHRLEAYATVDVNGIAFNGRRFFSRMQFEGAETSTLFDQPKSGLI